MLALWLALVLVAAAVAALLYQGFAIVLAVEMPRLDPDPPDPEARRRARVSVVIAARNEE